MVVIRGLAIQGNGMGMEIACEAPYPFESRLKISFEYQLEINQVSQVEVRIVNERVRR